MANKNNKRIKEAKYISEDQMEVSSFIKIILILTIIVLAVYFFTRIFVTKDLFNKNNNTSEVTKGEIDYDITLIGNMLNKEDSEYYVIIYGSKEVNAVYYSGLVSNYNRNTDHKMVYFADLDNTLNSKYIAKSNEDSNINTTDLNKFKVKNLALLKINSGKIVLALTDEEKIANELAYINEEI